jgi:lambda family phage portal protein
LSNWLPWRAPTDAEILPDQDMLVARSRDLNRNNGIASGGLQTLQDNVVGTGLRLAANPDYRALGKDIAWAEKWSQTTESLWRTWADSTDCDAAHRLNFAGLTALVFRSALEAGEALALPLWLERTETPFKTCLQLIDCDRLSQPFNQLPTVKLRGGVEVDDYGRPLAYHIRMFENWMSMMFPAQAWVSGQWERIPAETDFGRKRVIHLLVQDRIDQTRGKPILAPVIEQFRMLDSYQRTELQSAIVNSLVAGVIETPMDPAAITELLGGDQNRYLDQKNQYRPQMEGGTFIPLYPGDKLTPFTPSRPAPQFSNFVEAVLRHIGVCLGMPYELVVKDFSKTNYSSARAALLEAWRFFMARRTWIAQYWCAPVYRLWLEEAVNAGMIEAPGFYQNLSYYCRAKWIGPGRGWIDPVKEAEAAQVRMITQISTLEQECAEQGQDWNDVLEQLAVENARRKELNLPNPQELMPAPPRGEKPEPTDEAAPGNQPTNQQGEAA